MIGHGRARTRHQTARGLSRAPTTGAPPRARRRRGERGELLVETLVTITLVGLGVVAIVAALGSVTSWSTDDRTTAKTESLLWSYAEALGRVPYEACTSGGPRPYLGVATSALPGALPDGTRAVASGAGDGTPATVELTIATVKYWDQQANPATFVATCPNPDSGAQALTLTARSGDGTVTRTLTIYKRVA